MREVLFAIINLFLLAFAFTVLYVALIYFFSERRSRRRKQYPQACIKPIKSPIKKVS